MKLDKLCGFEHMCFDVDSYGVSDAMREKPASKLFRDASAPEKRRIAREYEHIAAEMRRDAARVEEFLDDTYRRGLPGADLHREFVGHELGRKTATSLFNEAKDFSRQARHLRWNARKDEFTDFLHKAGSGLRAWLHPT